VIIIKREGEKMAKDKRQDLLEKIQTTMGGPYEFMACTLPMKKIESPDLGILLSYAFDIPLSDIPLLKNTEIRVWADKIDAIPDGYPERYGGTQEIVFHDDDPVKIYSAVTTSYKGKDLAILVTGELKRKVSLVPDMHSAQYQSLKERVFSDYSLDPASEEKYLADKKSPLVEALNTSIRMATGRNVDRIGFYRIMQMDLEINCAIARPETVYASPSVNLDIKQSNDLLKEYEVKDGSELVATDAMIEADKAQKTAIPVNCFAYAADFFRKSTDPLQEGRQPLYEILKYLAGPLENLSYRVEYG
jgi:hypothetical protein